MSTSIRVKWDTSAVRRMLGQGGGLKRAVMRALGKAGSTALRDMRAEATKRVRARKRLKVKAVQSAFRLRRPKGGEAMEWALDVRGDKVPLSAYPHRQTKRGVSAAINQGKRSLVLSAFTATMKSGHKGVFQRRGPKRLPIDELFGSRPVDALLHKGEAQGVLERGRASFAATFERLLGSELEKVK